MATLQPGGVQTLYFPIDGTLAFTITSPGRVSFNARNPNGTFLEPREIFATETLSVAAGSTVSFEAITVAADYTQTLSGVGASSGGGRSGGGDDVSAVVVTGTQVTSYTENGVVWTIAYNVDGTEASWTVALSAADDLVVTANYVSGFQYVSGNYRKGGGYLMTKAQAKALRDEVLVAAGSAAAGFKANVTDLGSVVNVSGATTTIPGIVEWDGVQWRVVSGGVVESFDAPTFTGTGNSGTLITLTYPGWLVDYRGRMRIEWDITNDGATAGTIQPFITVNSVNLVNSTSSSGTSPHAFGALTIQGNNSKTSQYCAAGGASYSGDTTLTSGAYQTLSVNTDTTDFTIIVSVTNGTDATDPTTIRRFAVYVERM